MSGDEGEESFPGLLRLFVVLFEYRTTKCSVILNQAEFCLVVFGNACVLCYQGNANGKVDLMIRFRPSMFFHRIAEFVRVRFHQG